MISIFEVVCGMGLKTLRNSSSGMDGDAVVAGSKLRNSSDGMDGDSVVAGSKLRNSSDGMDGDSVVACTGDKDNLRRLFSSIVVNSLFNLMNIYEDIYLDKWVIMPNHIHFIIILDQFPRSKISGKSANLSDTIKSFKLHSQKRIAEAKAKSQPSNVQATTESPRIPSDESASRTQATTESPNTQPNESLIHNKIWHKSFYESIIRDQRHLFNIRKYIESNPKNWKKDKFHPKNQ